MFKIRNKFSTLFIFLLITVASMRGTVAQEITVAFQIPLEHHLAKNVLFFKKELEEISSNSVSVSINDYGAYLKDIKDQKDSNITQNYFLEKDILEAVQSRKVEIGMISLSRLSKLIPLADIFHQPFIIDSEKKAADMVAKDSVVRRSIENSLRNLGVMTLWWQPYGSVILVSNGSTVSNPEQMKDKKVRVFGETLGNVVLASGGKPTAIPNSLQYFAYKHKKVDIGMTTIADIKEKKIWEVMDTISLTNNANLQFLMIANRSWWNSISPNLRSYISTTATAAEVESVKVLKSLEAESYKQAIENGMKLVLLSNDDRDYWKEKSSPIYKKFLEKTGAKGQEVFDIVNSF
mgnify:CR=1 FL=1